MLSLISLTLLCTSPADAADISNPDPLIKQAFQLCKQGKVQEARELAAQAVGKDPNDWLAHESLSYFSWLQGDVVRATAEAQRAAVLGPDQEIVFTNLGQIYEQLYQYSNAIPEYDRATKIAPDDWIPWIGLARCFVLNNNARDGYAVLRHMESQEGQRFDWYYQIGRTYLHMDRADLAVVPLSKAKSLATTKQQKSDAAVQDLLALLRNNQKPRVRTTADDIFNTYHPQDHELYIRGASLLLTPVDPVSGKRFLKMSMKNLTSAKDSDAFFKVGQIFDDKADTVSYDADARRQWLNNAESAYRHAIALDPIRGSYHLALAGTLDRQLKAAEVVEELTNAQSLDSTDKLAPFLLSGSKIGHDDKGLESQPDVKKECFHNINLSEVRFNIDGVDCGCKMKLIQNALEKVSGVTLVSIVSEKPYRGKMLIDQSVTPIHDALLQALKTVFPFEYKDKTRTPGIKAGMYSCRPVQSTAEAVILARSMRNGDPLQFAKPQIRSGLGIVRFELAEVAANQRPRAGERTPL